MTTTALAPPARSIRRRWASQLAVAGLIAATIVVLHLVGRGALAAPPLGSVDALRSWGEQRDPVTIGFTVVRLTALVIAYHLVATSILMATGRLVRSSSLMRLADVATLPPLRGTVRRLVGLGLSTGMVLTQPLPTAQAHTQAPIAVVASGVIEERGERVVLERIPGDSPGQAALSLVVAGTERAAGPGRAVLEQVEVEASGEGPAVLERVALPTDSGGRAVLERVDVDPSPALDASSSAEDRTGRPDDGESGLEETELTETNGGQGLDHHIVEPGDHLWSIAADRLAREIGRYPTDAEISPYWESLVSANPQLVDPDLLFPGDEIEVPPVPGPT